MSYIVRRTVRGRDNRAVASPAGRENMSGGSQPPLQSIVTSEMGSTVSTTLSYTGTVATGSATGHGFTVGDIIRIAGATQTDYNGDKMVRTVADANTFTYDIYSSQATTATGTITSQRIRKRPHV